MVSKSYILGKQKGKQWNGISLLSHILMFMFVLIDAAIRFRIQIKSVVGPMFKPHVGVVPLRAMTL